MLRKTSLVLAIAVALMLPSASFGKSGDHRVGYHGRYHRHGVWGHCWPGGVWRYSGGWLGYGCWRWLDLLDLRLTCADECPLLEAKRTVTNRPLSQAWQAANAKAREL